MYENSGHMFAEQYPKPVTGRATRRSGYKGYVYNLVDQVSDRVATRSKLFDWLIPGQRDSIGNLCFLVALLLLPKTGITPRTSAAIVFVRSVCFSSLRKIPEGELKCCQQDVVSQQPITD